MREEPHKDSPQPSGSEMAGASASVSTAPPGSGNRIPACPFLTALQIPLQPLPQPRCRNERSRISSSSCSSSPHCQSGMRLETRRMGAPSTNLTAPSADTSPKRATVDTRTSVPSTTRASTGLRCEAASPPRLEGVPGLAATFSPTALCWPL
ncbi:proline-rich protein 3 isoform X4 [Bos mutus]|uniref:proline-rich protein 3 isoform X4 n=1 Tax=Bos mutus TaxID=72004 RepID=UPI0038B4D3D7